MDTAVGVVASDSGLAGAPDVLFMATSREEERDNGLLAAPQWAGGNRADELTKRGLGKASSSPSLRPQPQLRCCYRATPRLSHQPGDLLCVVTPCIFALCCCMLGQKGLLYVGLLVH